MDLVDNKITSLPLKFVSGERRLRKHQKSRAGCYRCKAKKIKCSETTPKCRSCLKNAAQCIYPDNDIPAAPLQINLVQNNHLGFSLHDMRLFHDFMTASRPHLPLESEPAWVNDIPVIAQQHQFLMHGILALGAAHLNAVTNLSLKDTADRHRALAMQGLNAMELARGNRTEKDREDQETRMSAVLATCYLLTFTSSYMGDSLNLFLVLVRACSSLTKQIVKSGYSSPLLVWKSPSATSEPHLEVMRRRLQNAPPLAEDDVAEAKVSLDFAERNCVFLPFQRRVFDHMKATVHNVSEPFESYIHFIGFYNECANLAPEDFAIFTDDTNPTSVMLQAHFLGIETLLKPWLFAELDIQAEGLGFSSLPASASLEGLAGELVRWPVEILDRQRGRFRKMKG